MNKNIFKNKDGSIHFGVGSPKGFVPATKADVENSLKNLGKMKFWRCNVCNDLHIGIDFPSPCPTCEHIDSYVEISEKEFRTIIGL